MDEFSLENERVPVDPRVGLSKRIALFGILSSLIFSVLAFGSLLMANDNSSTDSSSNYDSGANVQDMWAPPEFTIWTGDSNVAYKWTPQANCDNYGCVQAEFISQYGCPNSFYAAVNWLDKNDSVISYDNSSLPSLNAMQIAKLRFDDIEGTGQSAQMAEINCR